VSASAVVISQLRLRSISVVSLYMALLHGLWTISHH
jgi:hypothetical protein